MKKFSLLMALGIACSGLLVLPLNAQEAPTNSTPCPPPCPPGMEKPAFCPQATPATPCPLGLGLSDEQKVQLKSILTEEQYQMLTQMRPSFNKGPQAKQGKQNKNFAQKRQSQKQKGPGRMAQGPGPAWGGQGCCCMNECPMGMPDNPPCMNSGRKAKGHQGQGFNQGRRGRGQGPAWGGQGCCMNECPMEMPDNPPCMNSGRKAKGHQGQGFNQGRRGRGQGPAWGGQGCCCMNECPMEMPDNPPCMNSGRKAKGHQGQGFNQGRGGRGQGQFAPARRGMNPPCDCHLCPNEF